jgi:DNA-binding transcriptional regulator YiaG
MEYSMGNITRSERNQLRAIYENKRYWRVVSTSTFLAMRSRVIQGDMTMAELITFMPQAYRENDELVKALLKYEQNVLNVYPGRRAKWQIASADYIKRSAMSRKDIEKMFIKFGMDPSLAGTIAGSRPAPKPGVYDFYTNTSGVSDSFSAAKIAADAKAAAAKKAAEANATSAAQIAKQEVMVTKGISRTFAKVKQIRNKKEVWSKYDVLNISKTKLADWEVFLGNGNRNDTKVKDFLYKLVTIKTEAKAIAEIKKFAVTNNWSRFYNIENRTIAIDEFLTQVLPYYIK